MLGLKALAAECGLLPAFYTCTGWTPQTTTITFTFPNGQSVDYECEHVILEQFTKEYIAEKKLFPYIPFYIARYEKDIVSENDVEKAVEDLHYFRDEMSCGL